MIANILSQYSFLAYVFVAIGFVFLIKGGDWFVDAAPELQSASTFPSFLSVLP